MGRVALSCYVGSAIEFYDFMVYGTAAALVFPAVFFPHLSTSMATVASMATFGSAFLSRPIGAVVFGHFGDRLGRKKTLIATLLIMAGSTVGVGLVPPPSVIGVAAPVILLILRALQGFAVGGEWAGSALLSAEYAPPARRGHYGMFTLLGSSSAVVLSSLTFLGVNFTVGEHSSAFLQWGWRLPFLFSVVLVAIALYVRLSVEETPIFAREKQRQVRPEAPLSAAWREQRREIVLAAGGIICVFALVFMANSYLPTYANIHLGYSRNLILVVAVLGGLSAVTFVALSAELSDRFGRRRMMLIGAALCIPMSLLTMPLIDSGRPILYGLAIIGVQGTSSICGGPMASFIPELFATRFRYTGSAMANNLAGIVGGAVPPMIAGMLVQDFGSWSIGAMLAVLSAVSTAAMYLLPETKGADLRS